MMQLNLMLEFNLAKHGDVVSGSGSARIPRHIGAYSPIKYADIDGFLRLIHGRHFSPLLHHYYRSIR